MTKEELRTILAEKLEKLGNCERYVNQLYLRVEHPQDFPTNLLWSDRKDLARREAQALQMREEVMEIQKQLRR